MILKYDTHTLGQGKNMADVFFQDIGEETE